MNAGLRSVLENGVSAIDTFLSDPSLLKRLSRFYDEIELFNPSYGLVAAEGEEIVTRHILDCLAPVMIMKELTDGIENISAADLGSGSGLPGIVLASALPQWRFSLVERMGRRAGFLRNTLAAIGLAGSVHVVQKDLSEVSGQYDVITFRAFRAFRDIIADLDRILAPGGLVFAYKSSDENISEEISTAESYRQGLFSSEVIEYSVPGLDATRKLLVMRKSNQG